MFSYNSINPLKALTISVGFTIKTERCYENLQINGASQRLMPRNTNAGLHQIKFRQIFSNLGFNNSKQQL